MKILLTTIILIFSILIFVLLIKQYRAPAQDKTTTSAPVAISNTTVSPATTVSKPITPSTISLSATPTSTAYTSSLIQTTSNAVIHVANLKQAHHQMAGFDVNKIVKVTSSQGLKPKALKSALNAYTWALNHGKLGENKDILTVIDFTLPSYEKRMWVLNLHQNKVLMKLYTTQGAGSGLVYASRFSNTPRTEASSIGLYVTSNEYYGGHGKSMRIDGLQKGINDNARSRNIVIHEARYATPEYIRANHRAGRSWGCFAVSPSSKNALLHYVKGGSAFFVYARQIEKSSIVNNGPVKIA